MPLKGKSRSKKASRKQRQVNDLVITDRPVRELLPVPVPVRASISTNNPDVAKSDIGRLWGKRWTLNISIPVLGESNIRSDHHSIMFSPVGLTKEDHMKNVSNEKVAFSTARCNLPSVAEEGFEKVKSHRPRVSLKVLTKVFKFLDVQDLMSCRLVNSSWNKIASETISDRFDYPIAFSYCMDAKSYYSKSLSAEAEKIRNEFEAICGNLDLLTDISTNITLQNLCVCLRSSSQKTNFPWTSFEFTDGIIDRSPDAREFFALYGFRIRKLSINMCRVTLLNLHRLLSYLAPNVEHLKLEKLIYAGAQAEPYHQTLKSSLQSQFSHQLPHLRILELGSDGRMVVDWILRCIVTAAVNLEEIQNATLDHLDVVVQTNKVHCIKNFCLHLNLSLFKYEWILQKFVNFHLNLHQLVITVDQKWRGERQAKGNHWDALIPMMFPKVINKILRSCPETLHTLTLMPLGNFSSLEFPVMSKVQKLTLQTYSFVAKCAQGHWMNQMYFPKWLDFTKIFPNLRSLSLNLINWEMNFHREYGKSCIPSVRRLKVVNYFDSNTKIIPILAKMFPNVAHLTLKFDILKLNRKIMKVIWKGWPALVDLHFKFLGTTPILYCGGPFLDFIFTGMDTQSKTKPSGNCGQFISIPSITAMTGLRRLSFNFARYFDDSDDYLRDESGSNDITLPLTTEAMLYSVKFLPSLNVRLSFDENLDELRGLMKALKPLAKYVDINFNPDFIREIQIAPSHCTFCEVAEANQQWMD